MDGSSSSSSTHAHTAPSRPRREAEPIPAAGASVPIQRIAVDGGEFGERVRRLVAVAREHRQGLVLTHDNPDPDSIASAVGLAWLLEQVAGLPTRIAFGGVIGRAENRALVRCLKLPLIPFARVEPGAYDFVALVDTQPECGNHSWPERGSVCAVVDHHPPRETSLGLPFADVGGEAGATASLVTSYIRAAGLTPTAAIATALFYGIKSDTRDFGREVAPDDLVNSQWLFPLIDHAALSRIEHPSLPASYFAALHRAMEVARVHGDSVVADLGEVYTADIVAEVAERLLSLEDTRWTLAAGSYEGDLFVSVRTSDRRVNAGKLVREVIQNLGGSAGGHGAMAGGRLTLPEDEKEADALRKRIVRVFLKEFGAPVRGAPLV